MPRTVLGLGPGDQCFGRSATFGVKEVSVALSSYVPVIVFREPHILVQAGNPSARCLDDEGVEYGCRRGKCLSFEISLVVV